MRVSINTATLAFLPILLLIGFTWHSINTVNCESDFCKAQKQHDLKYMATLFFMVFFVFSFLFIWTIEFYSTSKPQIELCYACRKQANNHYQNLPCCDRHFVKIAKANPRKKQLYETPCPKCKKQVQTCECWPYPCPFCEKEFGFNQDWNYHILIDHEKERSQFL